MDLPEIFSIAKSGQAFSESFSRAGYILSQYLKYIESVVTANENFTSDPFNLAILGLFSKLRCHYYSFVLLETSQDQVGSQFLIEQIYETAVTLTYLLEEADEGLFSDYIAASIYQCHHLVAEITDRLQIFPNHPGLLELKDRLESYIDCNQYRNLPVFPSEPPANARAYWGPPQANTTAKRGDILGFNFLANPVRAINLKIVPASWLDLQINSSTSASSSPDSKAKPTVNFRTLRDTAHLCLHVTRAFIEEVVSQGIQNFDKEQLDQDLNALFVWFYDAHAACRAHFSEEVEEVSEMSSYN